MVNNTQYALLHSTVKNYYFNLDFQNRLIPNTHCVCIGIYHTCRNSLGIVLVQSCEYHKFVSLLIKGVVQKKCFSHKHRCTEMNQLMSNQVTIEFVTLLYSLVVK